MRKFRRLETETCPFINLPEARSGRWGQGLTAAKMTNCRWLKPMLVGQFDYLEWTLTTTSVTLASSHCATTKRRKKLPAKPRLERRRKTNSEQGQLTAPTIVVPNQKALLSQKIFSLKRRDGAPLGGGLRQERGDRLIMGKSRFEQRTNDDR